MSYNKLIERIEVLEKRADLYKESLWNVNRKLISLQAECDQLKQQVPIHTAVESKDDQ